MSFFNKRDRVFAQCQRQICDYEQLIDHMCEALRPAGLIEVVEIGLRVYDHNFEPIIPNPDDSSPHLARWMSLLNMAVRQRGGSPDAAYSLHEWLSVHPALQDVVYREYFVPTSPFMALKDPGRPVAELYREDLYVRIQCLIVLYSRLMILQAFLRAGRPLLLKSGLSEAFVDDLALHAHQELRDARTPTFTRFQAVYARKVSPAQ